MLLLAVVVCAQQRRPCIGTVCDADGAPIAAARVEFVYSCPGDASFLHDEQAAVTDARGRFRVDLWNGVGYAMWAIAPPDEQGRAFASAIEVGATGGGLVALRCAHEVAAREVRITGVDAWREHGAARMRVLRSALDFVGVPVALPQQGASLVELPPLPHGALPFLLETDAGEPLVFGELLVDADELGFAEPVVVTPEVEGELPDGARVVVSLMIPPGARSLTVVGNGERVLRRVGDVLDESCEVVVPAFGRPEYHNQLVTYLEAEVDRELVGRGPVRLQEIELVQARRGGSVNRLQVIGRPAAHVRASGLVGERALVAPRSDHFVVGYQLMAPFTSAADRVRGGLPACKFWSGVDVFVRAAAVDDYQPVRLAFGAEKGREGVVAPPMSSLAVCVRAADAGPGADAWVCVREVGADPRGWPGELFWHRCDSGGRVRVSLPTGIYGVHASDGRGMADARVAVEVGAEATVGLDLVTLPVMSCRVVDGAGRPVAGANVCGDYPVLGWSSDAFEAQRAQVRLVLHLHALDGLRTDADGRVDVPVFLSRDHVMVSFFDGEGKASLPVSARSSEAKAVLVTPR